MARHTNYITDEEIQYIIDNPNKSTKEVADYIIKNIAPDRNYSTIKKKIPIVHSTYCKDIFFGEKKNSGHHKTPWYNVSREEIQEYCDMLQEAQNWEERKETKLWFTQYLYEEYNLKVSSKAVGDHINKIQKNITGNEIQLKWLKKKNPLWKIVNFYNHSAPVDLKCTNCGHEHKVRVQDLDTLCPNCQGKISGFYTQKMFDENPDLANRPAKFYYIIFPEKGDLKVGITEKTVEERGKTYPNFSIEFTLETTLYKAWKIEQETIRENKEYRNYPEYLKNNGSSECFPLDRRIKIENSINRNIAKFN